jgi:hypothetical protein
MDDRYNSKIALAHANFRDEYHRSGIVVYAKLGWHYKVFAKIAELRANVVENVSGGVAFTHIDLYGDAGAVKLRQKEIFDEYHPIGYGTRVESEKMIGDKLFVRIFRSNSCD